MTVAPTYSQAFALGVSEEMRRDASIVVLGTDLLVRGGHWAQLKGVGEEFGPSRVFDTPISEAAMLAAGVGAAVTGLRPIVDLNFIDFVFGGMDETINQAAKLRYMVGAEVPLVIRATTGIAGGAAQHNNSLDMWFAATPGPACRHAGLPGRHQGPDQDRPAWPGSRRVPDAQEADRFPRRDRGRRRPRAVRAGDRPADRLGGHDRGPLLHGPRRPAGRGDPVERRRSRPR